MPSSSSFDGIVAVEVYLREEAEIYSANHSCRVLAPGRAVPSWSSEEHDSDAVDPTEWHSRLARLAT